MLRLLRSQVLHEGQDLIGGQSGRVSLHFSLVERLRVQRLVQAITKEPCGDPLTVFPCSIVGILGLIKHARVLMLSLRYLFRCCLLVYVRIRNSCYLVQRYLIFDLIAVFER